MRVWDGKESEKHEGASSEPELLHLLAASGPRGNVSRRVTAFSSGSEKILPLRCAHQGLRCHETFGPTGRAADHTWDRLPGNSANALGQIVLCVEACPIVRCLPAPAPPPGRCQQRTRLVRTGVVSRNLQGSQRGKNALSGLNYDTSTLIYGY